MTISTCRPSAWMTMADHHTLVSVRAVADGSRQIFVIESELGAEKKTESFCLRTGMVRYPTLPWNLDEETYEGIRREHALCAALDRGMRILAASGGSRVQMEQKLCARGVSREIAKNATEDLSERGYLREEQSALAAAECNLRKLWGDRRILADLRAKGYDGKSLAAVEAYLSERQDGAARCQKLLEKRYGAWDGEADKLIAALMRYGYTRCEIRTALQRMHEE